MSSKHYLRLPVNGHGSGKEKTVKRDPILPLDEEFFGTIKTILEGALQEMGVNELVMQLHNTQAEDDGGEHNSSSKNRNAASENYRYTLRAYRGGIVVDDNTVPTKSGSNIIDSADRFKRPINFQSEVIGELAVNPTQPVREKNLGTRLESAAEEIAWIIRNRHTKNCFDGHHGKHLFWIGRSLALRELDARCEKIAKTALPVYIKGQTGTGKTLAAYTIHCYSDRAELPFIEANYGEWPQHSIDEQLQKRFDDTGGGSLYLKGIVDAGDPAIKKLIRALENNRGSSFDKSERSFPPARIMLGINSDPVPPGDEQIPRPRRDLLQDLEFFCVPLQLPTLRDRWRDVGELIDHIKSSHPPGISLEFTHDAWAIVEDYPWPENVKQLDLFIKKLQALSETGVVTPHLISSYFPRIANYCSEESRADNGIGTAKEGLKGTVDNLLDGDGAGPGESEGDQHLHPAISRALKYLASHYKENINMAELAKACCVSASHLSYLLKRELNRSFKQILIEYRISKAKSLLSKYPARQITTVCSDVGFSDLSHFEKTFKKVVGVSPSTYRNRQRKPLSTTCL